MEEEWFQIGSATCTQDVKEVISNGNNSSFD